MKHFNRIIYILPVLTMLLFCLTFSLTESSRVFDDGTPWVDSNLRENLAHIDNKPDSPKDDFYLWVNYDWLKSAEIPPGSDYTNPFIDIGNEITDKCIGILNDTTLDSGDAIMVQHLYNAFMDWDARNALGVAPLQEIIDRISAVSTIDELTQMLCDIDYYGNLLFNFDVKPDPNDPGIWIADVQPGYLLLMDSAEYPEHSEFGDLLEGLYREYLPEMLKRLGYSPKEASVMLTSAFSLEAELAEGIYTSAETMAPEHSLRINNVMNRAEAETLCNAFPWLGIMDIHGYSGVHRYLVEQPAFLQKLDGIYREEKLNELKNYLIIKTVYTYTDYLDRESYDLYMEFYNRLYGIEGSMPDEMKACEYVRSLLPAQMTCAFLEKYDAAKMKADITRISEEAIDCYRKMLIEEDWLTEETRTYAIEKLDKMHIIAVFPEKWPDYGGLSLDGLGYYDCVNKIGRYKADISAGLADQPVDPDLWYYTREDSLINDFLITNAAYDPNSNTLIIMRGILGSVLYREDMSDEELYGSIGMIISHEISHAFDPTCAQFDAAGRLNNWWTEADYAAFDTRAKKLIDYYNNMTAFRGFRVPGENVQSEAIADMGSIKCMLNLLEQKKENVDYRTFFEAFARTWRQIISYETEYYFLMQDPHPPFYLRVNTVVQQFPQFHEAYGIVEGDGMWLAPEDRVLVW